MKEMKLEEIQEVSVSILDKLHSFCVQNNIKYSLAGGTLIGAIRHKGFIPWDDDIDVIMPRPDYERFCKMFKSDSNYALFSSNIGNSYLPFSRICELQKTYVSCPVVWNTQKQGTGIWIDIFPEDGVPVDSDERKQKMQESSEILDRIVILRQAYSSTNTTINRIKYYIKAFVKGDFSIKNLLNRHKKLCTSIPFQSCSYFGNYTFRGYSSREFFHVEDFSNTTLVEFNGKSYCALGGYDRHLRDLFGDYMQLPPIEKRVRNHSEHKYYWR